MDYLQRIIHEEMKKKLNEGFFDRFKGKNDNDRVSEEESRKRIEKALQNFRQSLINVCGNLLRYGQTIRDYQSVKTAGDLEKYANKYISSIGGYIYSIGKQEGDVLIPDSDYEDEAETLGNIPIPPQIDRGQNTEQEPKTKQDYDDPYQRGYLTPELYIEPENDVQEELPEEEPKIEYVTEPTVETDRYGKRITFFDDGSYEYNEWNSVYKIIVSDNNQNVGSFELIDSPTVRYLVYLSPTEYFTPCCEGSVPETRPTKIVTKKRGTVISDGNGERWRVDQKAEVEFES